MKKVLTLLVISISILTSCKKNDPIIGKWDMFSMEIDGSTFPMPDTCEKSYLIFGNDGKMQSVQFQGDSCEKTVKKSTYSIKEGALISKIEGKEKEESIDYVIIGDTMTLNNPGIKINLTRNLK